MFKGWRQTASRPLPDSSRPGCGCRCFGRSYATFSGLPPITDLGTACPFQVEESSDDVHEERSLQRELGDDKENRFLRSGSSDFDDVYRECVRTARDTGRWTLSLDD